MYMYVNMQLGSSCTLCSLSLCLPFSSPPHLSPSSLSLSLPSLPSPFSLTALSLPSAFLSPLSHSLLSLLSHSLSLCFTPVSLPISFVQYFNVEYIKFLQPTAISSTRLLITSETSGYPHIVLLEGNLPSLQLFSLSNPFKPVMADLNSKYVTQGEWNVLSSDVSSLLMVVHVSLYNPTINHCINNTFALSQSPMLKVYDKHDDTIVVLTGHLPASSLKCFLWYFLAAIA